MEETRIVNEKYRFEAMRLLGEAFAEKFAEFASTDERFQDLLMEISEDFMDEYIPIVLEDDRTETAMILMDNVFLTSRNRS